MQRLIALILLVLALAPTVAAQPTWERVDGPYGGTIVSSLSVQPDGVVLAATAGGLFRSENLGETWAPDVDGVDVAGIDARALLVRPDGSVLAATFGGGIYRRMAGDSRWLATGSRGQFATSLAEGPDGTLYAGTIEGLLRSDNGGATWSVYSVADRRVWVQAVAATANYVFVASSDGIYRSADKGLTWEFASLGMTTMNTTALMAAADGTLFAGTSSILSSCRLYRSRSEGRLWTCAQPSPDPLRVGAIAQDARGRIYVGGYRLVYHSDDGGNSWRQTAASPTTIHSIAAFDGVVLAGTFGRGVVRSVDRAYTWADSNPGLMSAVTDLIVSPSGDLYVATVGGVFHSADRGNSWRMVDDPSQPVRSARSLLLDGEGRLLSGTISGLLRYDPRDDSWSELGPPGKPAIGDLAITPEGVVYAGYYEGVYELRGNRWTSYLLIGPDQAPRSIVAVGVDPEGTLYAGGNYDSFRLKAGAGSWERLRTSAAPYFEAQVFEEDAAGDLYAGTRYFGVMRSRDGGDSWSPIETGLPGTTDVRAIAFDSADDLYMGTFGSGVMHWDTQRRRWEGFDAGMEQVRRVTALSFVPDGTAFAGTYGGGVYRMEATATAIEETQPSETVSLLREPFPNPSRGFAQLTLVHPHGATVSLGVYDLLGRRVSGSETRVSGSSRSDLEVPVSGLSAGLYLVRVGVTGAGFSWQKTSPIVVSR